MRILVVHPGPHFSVADVYTGWAEALTELGHRVHLYNLGDRLVFYDSVFLETTGWRPGYGQQDEPVQADVLKIRKATTHEQSLEFAANGIMSTCFQFWPEVVLVVMGSFMPERFLDVMRARRMKVVLLHTESPYEDSKQLEKAAHADLNLLNDPWNLRAYQQLGVPAHYMPHAYRPGIHSMGPGVADMETDFAFVGTGFESRCEFFEKMLATGHLDNLDVTLAGNWQRSADDGLIRKHLGHDLTECVDNELAAKLYRSAKAGINIYRRESEDEHAGEGWALSPREVEMAACGLFFVRDRRPESDEVFPMLPAYDSPEDAAEKIAWFIGHNEQREAAALKARAAIRDRTFAANARQLMGYLEKL